jgi:hypothetical protein
MKDYSMTHLQTSSLEWVTDEITGKSYPVPAGGAPEQGEETPQQESSESQENEGGDEDDDDDDFENLNGEAFLQSIQEEELRQQLEPHVKRWDAGVTRKFQELHSKLQPYTELGEYEQLSEAAQLYEILNSRPEDLYRALAQSLGYNVEQGQPGTQGQTPQQQQGQQGQGFQQQQPGQQPGTPGMGQNGGLTQQQYAQLPPDVKTQLDQHNQILTTLAEHYLNEQKSQQQQQEDEALDKYLSGLKDEFGDFDEEFVLAKMAAGQDGAKAVKAYQKNLKQLIAKQNAGSAPSGILGGGGQVPQETVNPAELNNKDVTKLVAGLMSQAQQEST